MTSGKIVFVDAVRDAHAAAELKRQLSRYEMICPYPIEQAVDYISVDWPGILVCVAKTAGIDVLPLLKRVNEIDSSLPVILISEPVATSVKEEVFRMGIHDFIEKPCPTEILLNTINRAFAKRALVLENRELHARILAGQALLQDLLSRNWEHPRPKNETAPAMTEIVSPAILSEQVSEFEKKLIEQELIRQQGNIKETLIGLGLPRQTLYDKMHKYGLKRTDYLH